ncbi:MAG: ribonuclease J [Rhodothalassiaceae bacterium]
MSDLPGFSHNDLVFLPLGGTDEVGMNMALYHLDGKWIMVDCGMTFAGPGLPGVDLIFPDPGFIEERHEDLLGIVITHGHEDHIGALPHLWPRLKAPIFASRFTAELIREKLEEAQLLGQVSLTVVAPDTPVDLGPFHIDYVPMAHSIPEAHSLLIKTRHGRVFHTGDWKFDDQPQIGVPSPPQRLEQIGQDGVLAAVGDSTNIFNKKPSGSEQPVKDSLGEIVAKAPNRVVITTFASNTARLRSIAEVAKATGRQLALAGRSMDRIWRIGRDTGYLADLPDPIDMDEVGRLPKSRVLIACTGCQGEHRAAMARLARGDHRALHLSAGDLVIFSSKIIPGNEREVGNLVNLLAEQDIQVMTERDAFVHVSGHPGRPELERLYGWLKPQMVVAVHGERHHVKEHAAFARSLGMAAEAARNGRALRLAPGGLRLVDEVITDCLILDGIKLVPMTDIGVSERRKIAEDGHLCVILLLDEQGQPIGPPELIIRGVPAYTRQGSFETVLEETVEEALEGLRRREREDDTAVREAVRIAARRLCRRMLGKNVVVDVRVLRLEEDE